jgi:hypothetical protein
VTYIIEIGPPHHTVPLPNTKQQEHIIVPPQLQHMFVEGIITSAILISTNRALLNIHYFSFNSLKKILKTKFENTNILKII